MRIFAEQLAVVTIVRGRHDHLRRQLSAIAAFDPQPMLHIVVAMGDPGLPGILSAAPGAPAHLVDLPMGEKLPLSAARNRGVLEAGDRGARAVVLLDVDCIPERSMMLDYAQVLTKLGQTRGPAVASGRVRYLPEGMTEADYRMSLMERLGRDNASRVVPDTDEPVVGDPRMLWSLNLATTVEDWRLVGGFDERYEGYGGEDTDFGQRLARAGGAVWWTRRAGVFHQWHPVSRPPVEHVADIVTNANLFHSIWGWYPMEGWLEEFERRGLVGRGDAQWHLTA